jgi:hypothetical protein
MTRKIHKRSKVSRTESTNEPRQPSRLEKKRNTHAGCPTGHGPTRGVSGVSGSTTLFHMLAQTRRELLAAVHDRRNRDQRGSRRCAAARSAGYGAGRARTRGESSPSPRAQHRRKIVPSAGPRPRLVRDRDASPWPIGFQVLVRRRPLARGVHEQHDPVLVGQEGPLPAWLMHYRGYHASAVPTWEGKVRVLAV